MDDEDLMDVNNEPVDDIKLTVRSLVDFFASIWVVRHRVGSLALDVGRGAAGRVWQKCVKPCRRGHRIRFDKYPRTCSDYWRNEFRQNNSIEVLFYTYHFARESGYTEASNAIHRDELDFFMGFVNREIERYTGSFQYERYDIRKVLDVIIEEARQISTNTYWESYVPKAAHNLMESEVYISLPIHSHMILKQIATALTAARTEISEQIENNTRFLLATEQVAHVAFVAAFAAWRKEIAKATPMTMTRLNREYLLPLPESVEHRVPGSSEQHVPSV